MPQGHTEAQLWLALQKNLVAADGDFEDAFEGRFGHIVGIQKADALELDSEFLKVAAIEFHDYGDFLGAADGDAEFGVFEFGEGFNEGVDADVKAVFCETI